MPVSELEARVKEDNPDPRVSCALLLDTSSSMDGEPIRELNEGFRTFCDEIKQDPLAKKRTEVAVVTFGGVGRGGIPFTEGRGLAPRAFTANGGTPMGAALSIALDEIEAQKQAYKKAGLEYYRPWLFRVSDGEPTDGHAFDAAAKRVREAEAAKGVSVFSIGVGSGVNMSKLNELSNIRQALMLNGYSFREMFSWLSASMSVVSNSSTFGSSDSGVAQAESMEQHPLPPPGWATW